MPKVPVYLNESMYFSSAPLNAWSNPASWPELGRVPLSSDNATIPAGRTVYLDTNGVFRSLTVGGTLQVGGGYTLDAYYGNIIFQGQSHLTSLGDPRATITLHVPNDALMSGGGMDPIGSDIGLWIMDDAQVNLQGGAKTSWTTLTTPVTDGASTIQLVSASNWAVGDTLVVCPTELVTVGNHWQHHELRLISSISGTTVSFTPVLAYPHPSNTINGRTFQAEVLNLTRDIVIQGQPGSHHRTHIFTRSTLPQYWRNVTIKDTGPRTDNDDIVNGNILGRWALHFHHCHDGSRGSMIEDCVIWRCGSWGFVPHESHGMTFNRCVAYDTLESPFRWDEFGPLPDEALQVTNDTLYSNCVVAYMHGVTNRDAAFSMLAGTGNNCVDCTASGIGGYDCGGAIWQEFMSNAWGFDRFVVHNVDERGHGIFNWKNDDRDHILTNVHIFNVQRDSMLHGAYNNSFQFDHFTIRDKHMSSHAFSNVGGHQQTWDHFYMNMNANDNYCLVLSQDLGAQGTPQARRMFSNWTLMSYNVAAIHVETEQFDFSNHLADFRGITFYGNEFYLQSDCHAGTSLRLESSTGPHISPTDILEIKRWDQPGDFTVAAWNASVTRISAF